MYILRKYNNHKYHVPRNDIVLNRLMGIPDKRNNAKKTTKLCSVLVKRSVERMLRFTINQIDVHLY